jgi:hypothetical protein
MRDRPGSVIIDVARLLFAFVAGGDFEAHLLAFFQRLESRHVDRREMREEIFAAAVRGDEAETFRIIEPLDRASRHLLCPFEKLN